MKIKDIRIAAQVEISLDISEQANRIFLNKAIRNIAMNYDTAKKREAITLTATKDEWVDLPNDFIKVYEITDSNGFRYNDYNISDGQIKFYDDGTYSMQYYRLPKDATVETDEPEINVLYHMPCSLFIAAKERAKQFGDNDSKYIEIINDFNMQIAEVDRQLRKQGRRKRNMKAPNWGM